MKWIGRQGSRNVLDHRGKGFAIGGIGGIIVVILGLLMGQNPLDYLNQNQNQNQNSNATQQSSTPTDDRGQFVSVVLRDTEDVWHKIFTKNGASYQEPQLVLFSRADQSACGFASAATGPFYCPLDSKVYIDLSFYDQLKQRFGAPGDFAMAYVIAHEVGHHVQKLLGITDQVQNASGGLTREQANALSVKLELQADFLAGVWAHHANEMNQILEPGDIDEALQAANAIGDDRLQMESQGYVVPESFTHGTSEQRMYWFKKGYSTGDVSQGDTFAR